MRVLLTIAVLLHMGAAAENVTYVFKGLSAPLSMNPSHSIQRMTFGLNERQVSAIKNLTEGQVDFGNVFAVEAAAELRTLSADANFSSVIYPNVPPPVEAVVADPELKGQWWIKQLNVEPAWAL